MTLLDVSDLGKIRTVNSMRKQIFWTMGSEPGFGSEFIIKSEFKKI